MANSTLRRSFLRVPLNKRGAVWTDLADTELGHLVTCADCQTETEYVYDAELDDLVPADEDETDETDDALLVADDEEETEFEGPA